MNNNNIRLGFVEDDKLLSKFAFAVGQAAIVIIGRDKTAQVIINKSDVSAQHAQLLVNENGELFIVDLGSTNGTYVNGRRLTKGVTEAISSRDTVTLANPNGIRLVFNPEGKIVQNEQPKEPLTNTISKDSIDEKLRNKQLIFIGRSNENDIVLAHQSISRQHASIERKGDKFLITDLDSLNGTFVNGKRITGSVVVSSADLILIGRFQIPLSGKVKDLSAEIAIRTVNIQKRFDNGKIGLHNCSIQIPSKSLLAVMGPSGCGKSTLLKALNGDSPPSSGNVYIGGLELAQNYDYLKTQIGYVPQDDIVHRELTVEQSLFFAAKLRLANVDQQTIQEKINQVLKDLNIERIRKNLVGKISGGQRKRVAIAIEILSDPLVLFLDEPTSPLDPQTIEEFLGILKDLSLKGTTVVMVTHKPEDLNYMDSVIFLAEGGHFVYHGSTKEYLSHFNAGDTVKVYAQLAMPNAQKWINQNKSSQENAKAAQQIKPHNINNTGFMHQLWWLTMRYFRIKFNDGLNTAILIGQAPIIAGLLCLIFNEVNASVLFLMAVCAVWFGTNNAAREIVCENSIYKRERMFNQRIITYILSKLIVLGSFAAIQALLFSMIISARYIDSDPAWNNALYTFIWMLTLTLSATMMGLFISSIASTSEKVMTIVPIVLIPQVMLAGAVAKIPNALVEMLSYLTLSRWGNEGFSFIQDKVATKVPDMDKAMKMGENANDSIPLKDTQVNAADELSKNFDIDTFNAIFGKGANSLSLDFTIVMLMGFVFFVAVYIALKMKDSIKIR